MMSLPGSLTGILSAEKDNPYPRWKVSSGDIPIPRHGGVNFGEDSAKIGRVDDLRAMMISGGFGSPPLLRRGTTPYVVPRC
jgi:hypothetical protein